MLVFYSIVSKAPAYSRPLALTMGTNFIQKFCSSERFINALFCLVSLCLLGITVNSNNNFKLGSVQKCLLDAIREIPFNISKELKHVRKRSSLDDQFVICINLYAQNVVLKTNNRTILLPPLTKQKLVDFYHSCVIEQHTVPNNCSYALAPSNVSSKCYIYSKVSDWAHYCFNNRTTFTGLWLEKVFIGANQTQRLLRFLTV